MAIEEHLEQLQNGLETWNRWRARNSSVKPDLSGANLSRARLNGLFEDLDLRTLCIYMNLCEADFSGADLTGADLTGADLTGANFTGANLTGAMFYGALLTKANFTKANLSGASGAILIDAGELSGSIMPDGTINTF